MPACASSANYETKHGFDVFLDGQDGPVQAEAEAAIDMAFAQLVRSGVYTKQQVAEAVELYADGTSIRVREGSSGMGFPCGASSPTGYCWGRFWSQYLLIEIVHQECVASTALVHELLHWIHYAIENRIDNDHLDQRMFVAACRVVPDEEGQRLACMRSTVERAANWQLCIDRCGDLCVPEEEQP